MTDAFWNRNIASLAMLVTKKQTERESNEEFIGSFFLEIDGLVLKSHDSVTNDCADNE